MGILGCFLWKHVETIQNFGFNQEAWGFPGNDRSTCFMELFFLSKAISSMEFNILMAGWEFSFQVLCFGAQMARSSTHGSQLNATARCHCKWFNPTAGIMQI